MKKALIVLLSSIAGLGIGFFVGIAVYFLVSPFVTGEQDATIFFTFIPISVIIGGVAGWIIGYKRGK